MNKYYLSINIARNNCKENHNIHLKTYDSKAKAEKFANLLKTIFKLLEIYQEKK